MNTIAFIAACIVLATIVARGADHPSRPNATGWVAMLRLHAEKLALLAVGASAGSVIFSVLAGIDQPPQAVALLVGTALWMLTHPAGWLRYVTRGRDPGCNELRPDP